jgi:hypothetical protein
MRRRVLGSLAGPRRRFPRLLAVASVATAALGLALALALHREVPQPAPRPEPPTATEIAAASPPLPRVALLPPLPVPALGPAPATPAQQFSRAPRRSVRPIAPRHPARRATAPALAAKPPEEEPAAPLQIQFNTPGGTRIIWVLDPADPTR